MEFGLFIVGGMVLLVVSIFMVERWLEAAAAKIRVKVNRVTGGQMAHVRFIATDAENHSAFAAKPAADALIYRWYTGMGDQGQRILGWRQRVLNRALRQFRTHDRD